MTPRTPASVGEKRPEALRAIIAYKLVRASLAFLFAAATFVFAVTGRGALELVRIAVHLREHMAHSWSAYVADLLMHTASGHRLLGVSLVLVLDGSLTALEGWSLHRGWWWGPWLVVVATSGLLPLEVVAIDHHPSPIRITILIVNVAIVLYLIRRIKIERSRSTLREPASTPAPPR